VIVWWEKGVSHSFLCLGCLQRFGVIVGKEGATTSVHCCPFCGKSDIVKEEIKREEFEATIL
jgi:rRNA maturation endonuclease Nob1